ncbi:hypothetical protein ACFPT7_06800 [Acidicapsa dinghuensis]|uniref:Circularly permuted type 2 ATP-grasp protein n=1 Tax=Acidicapsa dinghuensis TaxID=2218256 RepID=A0ABW1ED84_9BACT|nr:hypothetical protein [Acidicapsa dinghuensis]
MIPEFRAAYNRAFRPEKYLRLLENLELEAGTHIGFRVAETPIFLTREMLDEMANAGAELTQRLMSWPEYLTAARKAIPAGYDVAGDSAHPHFLTADFALVEGTDRKLEPKLVEIQAFPSVFGYQALLCHQYREVFGIDRSFGTFLSGLDEDGFWELMGRAVLGKYAPENVVLAEVDPLHQKTLPDFLLTSKRLGIPVVDIATIEPAGRKLYYRDEAGRLTPIHRIYNRAIADEIIVRGIELPFDLTSSWDVEWAGHPNWYFLVSKFSLPWLTATGKVTDARRTIPPAAFVDDFLAGPGLTRLAEAGVPLRAGDDRATVYESLLLKPLFSFAGKGIQFAPTRADLEAIPEAERKNYLVQQRMHFAPTIETPHGRTQAEIRILYIWPDEGNLTPALSLVRLGRGKMMGVDHNRDLEWVGASAAFWR